ncbi:HAMP domain-containing histidine kinase [Phototrophicus methaneseepsis]|uniref:histidine kinase n=1 Tax=Phototrophicus methaneseepsis TaxID=2710758 RepID=A0A7S8EBS0_9CHLR|nr:HAMP domain-containing sensor histidine kinase [Phototrophicus methaneseepsis]QPC84011.1 HAMP domain-containing histidine kinase [Phototrophicus methaneseepsis]
MSMEILKFDAVHNVRMDLIKHTEDEQALQQITVFKAAALSAGSVCVLLAFVYLFTGYQAASQTGWPAYWIGTNFAVVGAWSAIALAKANVTNFKFFSVTWMALAAWLVFTFGLFQSEEFLNIAALGSTIIIILGIFLQVTKNPLYWAAINASGYLFMIYLEHVLEVPPVDLGTLTPLVIFGVPVMVMFILAAMGQVTIRNIQVSLLESENRRRHLEVQEEQLIEFAREAEQGRKKAEEVDRVKSAFLASMSHELRTPLNSVINFTQFVLDGDTGEINEEQGELLQEVVASSHHLLALINDVLDISKIESGSLHLFVEEDVELQPIIDRMVSTARSLRTNPSVRIETEIADDLPHIRADKQRILQILLNIISNACKFTEDGIITIKAHRAKEDEIVISVTDTGIGIAAKDFGSVFEPFKQTRTVLNQGKGTGLGMPIARSLTEAHGGHLDLESEVGKGSTFSVTLPIKSEALIPYMN